MCRVKSDFSYFLRNSYMKVVFNRKQNSILGTFYKLSFQIKKNVCFSSGSRIHSEDLLRIYIYQISKILHKSNRKNK